MHTSHARVLLAVALLAAAQPGYAQQARGIEVGIDGEIARQLTEPQSTEARFPVSRVRVGFYLTPTISLEPALAVAYVSESGGSSVGGDFLLGMLLHLSADRTRAQPYARPFVGLAHSSLTSVSVSEPGGAEQRITYNFNAVSVGAGFGVKLPVADRVGARVEGAFAHTIRRGIVRASNRVSLLVGLSFFTAR